MVNNDALQGVGFRSVMSVQSYVIVGDTWFYEKIVPGVAVEVFFVQPFADQPASAVAIEAYGEL